MVLITDKTRKRLRVLKIYYESKAKWPNGRRRRNTKQFDLIKSNIIQAVGRRRDNIRIVSSIEV